MLLVSASDPESSRPGSSYGHGTALSSGARKFTLIVSLFTFYVYKWVLGSEFNFGGIPVMDQHPIQKEVEILIVAQ